MKYIILLLICTSSYFLFSQSSLELSRIHLQKGIQLYDIGKYDESIEYLKKGKTLDPKNPIFDYEIALAFTSKGEYESAISILNKVLKNKSIHSDYYQLLGNCYSMMGNPQKAIKTYEKGMKRFPNSGNLHLEKGNVYLNKKEYSRASENYMNAIKTEPMYSSSYYRLALLYAKSSNKLNSIFFSELYFNISVDQKRISSLSELIYSLYHDNIRVKADTLNNEVIVNLCQAFTIPFCIVYSINMSIPTITDTLINLKTINQLRTNFIVNYYKDSPQTRVNPLIEYQKTIYDKGHFEAYNYHLLQVGANDEFLEWMKENKGKYTAFIDWYNLPENRLFLKKQNVFIGF